MEAVAKFRQITGQVLVTDAMIHSPDIAFDVGDQGMDPGKQSDRVFSRTSHGRYMKARLRVQDPIGLPTIRAGHHLCCQTSLSPRLNLVAAYPGYLAHGGKPGFISRGFHRHPDFGFTRGATATFAWFGAADLGIIQFDQPGQLVRGLALRHGRADLMAHDPHRFISPDLKDPLPRQHGGAAFLSPHQEDHPEPFSQRRPGLMKNRAGRPRGLVTTGSAGI